MSHELSEQPLTTALAAPQPRPFFKKKRFLIPAGVLVLGMALGSCSGGSKQASDASPAAATSAPAAAAPASSAAAAPAATPAAPVAPPAPPAAPAGPAVGAPFSVKMGNGNVAKITIVSAVRTDAVTTTAFAAAPKSGSYLLLDVLWETETGKTSSNPFYFSAKDSNGRKADLNLFADNQLGSGDVLPGDKTRGFIAFDTAAGASTVMISTPLMQEAARIQIPG
ncbi:DUF4352 domain-containing protein [Arthrobacter sp. AL08]|uniref:DUF4352 domain-containing protein n=1 Tax=unclassified Arthrobacter TaxID=235627 RepID=UPI001CFF7B60|nr:MULTISPECIES: DUF4352 domain-containing protein [unclassified Arthrobacter]MCB5281885.1 hypothetical protein [Arthrobacter sp. ES1]MDI3242330.1 DUF4352 domain-containing protein [Arthrobacter sp. AL05]MDI3278340.1 DUF4352 domain-containing protein [Arthrobacter sp. AL08]WGZ78120.1 DUF4352 domain-containing protein [Arthrobacter sp. EM1]